MKVIYFVSMTLICFIYKEGVQAQLDIYQNKKIRLHCNGSTFVKQEKNYMNRYIEYDVKYRIFYVKQCEPVLTSYAKLFEAYGEDPSSIMRGVLDIQLSSSHTDFKAENFEGLPEMNMLALEYIDEETVIGKPKPGFLEPLKKLVWLKVSNALLPSMPMESVIDTVILERGVSLGEFGGCSELISVILIQWEIREDSWLRSCPEITELSLENMSAQSVIRAIRGATSLIKIMVSKCSIFSLPKDIFDGMQNLETLDLRDNYLNTIYLNEILPSLETLILSRNNMVYQIAELLNKLPKLKSLKLDDNSAMNLCRTFKEYNDTAEFLELKTLDLSNINTKVECVDDVKFPGVENLVMNYYDEKVLNLHTLLKWRVPLKISLYHNAINEVNFTKTDYATLRKSKANITIYGPIHLSCDCLHRHLARALRENLLKSPNEDKDKVVCDDMNETSLVETTPNQTECIKSYCEGCICRRMWTTVDELSNGTEADCRDAGVNRIPHVDGLQKLLAHNNRIELHERDIPDSLIYLDLTRNDISSIEDDATRKLFSVKNRQLLLSGNPIVCNCKNRQFLNAIQIHHKQVLDYKNMTCAGEEKMLLRNVDISKLCDVLNNIYLIISLAVCGGVLALVILAVVLNYCFGQEIRIFLYARGWCLFCVKEDSDDEKIYDAFVSFCHEDDALICEELVPKLEELGYKLCIHYRDWVPGDLIPTQIIRSVETSRRTIIALSNNFACSLWGSLEFKAAHARALKEGVARVILIVLDDVIKSENLDRDIRSYIRTNTYVKWDDPWFWDKIQYALRRRRQRDHSNIEIQIPGDPGLHIPPPEVVNLPICN